MNYGDLIPVFPESIALLYHRIAAPPCLHPTTPLQISLGRDSAIVKSKKLLGEQVEQQAIMLRVIREYGGEVVRAVYEVLVDYVRLDVD